MGVYLQCGKNNIHHRHFLVGMAFLLCQHGGVQGKHYTVIDLPVHGTQIEPSPIFIACCNCEL